MLRKLILTAGILGCMAFAFASFSPALNNPTAIRVAASQPKTTTKT